MDRKKRRIILICFALIVLVAAFSGLKLFQQRELNLAMEQEQVRQERITQLYRTLNRNRPLLSNDPMEIPQVVIGLAGLRSIGFSQGEVEEIWISSEALGSINSERNHPDYREVSVFIIEGGAGNFENALLTTYQENFEAINAQFPNIGLVYAMTPETLPLSVLHEVIALWEAENPPQPRPVVETESEP